MGSLQQILCLSMHPVALRHTAHKAKDTQVLRGITAKATLVTCFAWASEVFYLFSHGG